MKPELDCKWHFAKQLGGREDGPNDPMSENFKKTPYASLIRESLQNSLDVPLDSSKPVRVEYLISSIKAMNFPNFFELKKHIKGCLMHFPNNDDARASYQPMLSYLNSLDPRASLNYIAISDFNTTGMDYDDNSTNSPFYAFVRAAGVSSKGDTTAGGSFGYGKAAYFYISPIRTVLVSTMTKNGEFFFEGVSSLCTHQHPDVSGKFVSVGYYDNNEGNPQTQRDMIPVRFQREEPGTDIFVLGLQDNNREGIYHEMIEAVLRNFWMAIYKNKLEVKVGSTEINSENIESLMAQYFPLEDDTTAKANYYNPRPYLEAVANSGSDARHVHLSYNMPTIGNVEFYAYKVKGATDKILYMRKPMMLVKARRTQSSNGFYGVFVCEDYHGNEYLRKTENPAHDEWKAANWRVEGRISQIGKSAIEDVEGCVIKAINELFANNNTEVQDIKGLEDFLYIPTAVEDDESENESLLGQPINQKEEESNSITTDISEGNVENRRDTNAIGKIMIDNQTDSRNKKNKNGDNLSGHGIRKKKRKGGGGLAGKRIDSHYNEDPSGVEGTVLSEIPVKYRVFAQTENGAVVHIIVIHSEIDVEKGRIDLLIGGEQSDEVITIKECSLPCTIRENILSELQIQEGTTTLKVRFADNMRHAVKLDAYEYK